MGETYKLSRNSQSSYDNSDDLNLFNGQRISKGIFEDRYKGRSLKEVISSTGLNVGDTFEKTTLSGNETYKIIDMFDLLDEAGFRIIQVRTENTKNKKISIISADVLISGLKDKSIKKTNT